jgi:hypothetical protein
MNLTLGNEILIWAFALAFIIGAIASRSNFCTMGSVSDWVNMGDRSRLRSWFLAMAVAIIGVAVMDYMGLVDMSLTTNNATSNPPYRVANVVWLRYIVGGFIFGIGMTLGSGCGSKTLLRLGGGNFKSLVVLICIGIAASTMMFTSIDYTLFLQWMTPLATDMSLHNIPDQSLGTIVGSLSGAEDMSLMNPIMGGIVALLMLVWIFKSKDFRGNVELIAAGLVIGGAIATAWYITAGEMGQTYLSDLEFADTRPYAVGAQSFTFISPPAHAYQYIEQGFNKNYLSFGLVALLGVVIGSFVYSIVSRNFRVEWFSSMKDFITHVIGGLLMGIGGILGMGCTIGQGITGVSTLAIGSYITLGSIIFGSALTMKIQYYRMVYEDEASFPKALLTSLVDMKLLPGGLRRLDAV